ncbi:hypothetical protein B0H10DRAFT_1958583 [Mycena sp. CBHHK59/15]|nr:hypothetical protein B0H10DRAFT_1958583 [Mycena sp. CBHHK59/15]
MTTIPLSKRTRPPSGRVGSVGCEVAALTAKSVELTQLCVDVQSSCLLAACHLHLNPSSGLVPAVALSKTSDCFDQSLCSDSDGDPSDHCLSGCSGRRRGSTCSAGPSFVQGTPRTPTQLEAAHPPGSGDFQTWHVVIRGREPGLYAASRKPMPKSWCPQPVPPEEDKPCGGLGLYRLKYTDQKVEKWTMRQQPLPRLW